MTFLHFVKSIVDRPRTIDNSPLTPRQVKFNGYLVPLTLHLWYKQIGRTFIYIRYSCSLPTPACHKKRATRRHRVEGNETFMFNVKCKQHLCPTNNPRAPQCSAACTERAAAAATQLRRADESLLIWSTAIV